MRNELEDRNFPVKPTSKRFNNPFFFPFSLSSWLILANCIFGFVLLWLFKVRRVGKYTYSLFFFLEEKRRMRGRDKNREMGE